MDDDTPPLARDEVALVDRLWRSGTSATAVSPSTRDDLDLLQRFLSFDDRAAVGSLLRRHRVATWRLAASITMNVTAAEAAVEAAWREVLDGEESPISTWSNPRAWLFEVTRRHALIRGAAPGMELDLDADIADVPFDQTGDIGLLAAAFSLLDEVARTAVWLHTVEGFDDVDIAHVIGLDRLETHELIDGAMDDLRSAAIRAQITAGGDRCGPALSMFLDYLAETLPNDAEEDLLTHLRPLPPVLGPHGRGRDPWSVAGRPSPGAPGGAHRPSPPPGPRHRASLTALRGRIFGGRIFGGRIFSGRIFSDGVDRGDRQGSPVRPRR